MVKERKNLLGEYIQQQLDNRNMTVTEFGDKSGIAHTILFRLLKGTAIPTLGTLDKLARFCKTDIGVLARMCFPDASTEQEISVKVIAEQINQLPAIYREAMIAMVRGLLAEQQRSEHRK